MYVYSNMTENTLYNVVIAVMCISSIASEINKVMIYITYIINCIYIYIYIYIYFINIVIFYHQHTINMLILYY